MCSLQVYINLVYFVKFKSNNVTDRGLHPKSKSKCSAPVDVVKSTLSEEEGRETLDKPEKLVQGQSSWLYQWLSAPMIVNFSLCLSQKWLSLNWCLVVDQLFKPIVLFYYNFQEQSACFIWINYRPAIDFYWCCL